MSRRMYAVHRVIALIAFAQLFVWTTTGLLFSLIPKGKVDGARVDRAHEGPIESGAQRGNTLDVLSAAEVVRRAGEEGVKEATKVELRGGPGGVLYYVVRGSGGTIRLDARTGAVAKVTLEEAAETARRDQPGRPEVLKAELVERDAHPEYRGRALPAYRIALRDEGETAVYVDAKTGDVTARRTRAFRIFDFLFAIHTMDYTERSRLNTPWLTGTALLGVLTVLSGGALWGVRVARRIRGKKGNDKGGALAQGEDYGHT